MHPDLIASDPLTIASLIGLAILGLLLLALADRT
jgi:hypothetical protein